MATYEILIHLTHMLMGMSYICLKYNLRILFLLYKFILYIKA